ncbi:hypothetical protein LJR098_002550 [Rhizobium sp. LjRoot98]|uniref:hypothetical protein n=1 Tax=unclassified Rhizobium TaxID=2613769 RepID=UPI0007149DF1|nr:hypothetical protein [Rhizobium sp. Root1204]KQV33282.1 hypothetical protein ASC96_30565 [Rhizobium sp. Root1204]
MTKYKNTTGAQVRGQIQSGETGDIRPGFDPAAAPIETDAEAAGQPITPEQARIAVADRRHLKPDVQENFDGAMRKPNGVKKLPDIALHPVAIVLGLIIALGAGLVIFGLIGT